MSLNIDPSLWNLRTSRGIPYKLKEGGPTGNVGRDGGGAQETVIIRASDLAIFIGEHFPAVVITPAGRFFVTAPRGCPGFNSLCADSISFKPFIQGKPWSPWGAEGDSYGQFLELDIQWKPLYGDQDRDPSNLETFLEVNADMSTSFLQMTATKDSYFIASTAHKDPKGVNIAIGAHEPVSDVNLPAYKMQPSTDWNVKFPKFPWQYVGYIMPVLRQALGKVNSAAMPLLGNAPVETVLFMGASLSRQYQMSEDDWAIMAQLDLKFNEKSLYMNDGGEVRGQNHFYRPETGSFDRLKIGGVDAYEKYNLNSIWS